MTVAPSSRIVQTVYGKVQGRRLINTGDKQVDAFQGIPFAQPPVGPLRFKKPVPPEAWDGIKSTITFGPRCPASPLDLPGFDELLKVGETSEDCLYLNVFTPCWEAPAEGFPVLFFIHGGAFEMGDAMMFGDVNLAEHLVRRGFVVVTCQYRLGHLGFLSTGDSVCPGNFGMWDQTEALKWVQGNIQAFGGDKANVTVIGQSAGSASVDLLHLSPHSTSLFHRGVCMAGTADCRWASNQDQPKETYARAELLGIKDYNSTEELIEKLRAVPADALTVDMTKRQKASTADFETVPIIDGDFFPAPFDELRKTATAKPMMYGVTKEEGIFLTPPCEFTPEGMLQLATVLACHETEEKQKLAEELGSAYTGDVSPDNKELFLRKMMNFSSDYWFNAGTLKACKKMVAAQDQPVYLYVFEHFNPAHMGPMADMMPLLDSTHGSDGFFLLKKSFFGDVTSTETDDRITELFTTAITNFARSGNPNAASDVESKLPTVWAPLSRDNYSRNLVITSDGCHMNEQFFEGRTERFIEIIDKYRK